MIENFIPVAFITDDNYVIPTGVAIQSLKLSKRKETSYDVFIICQAVSQKNKTKFKKLEDNDVRINFIDINMDTGEFDEDGYYVSSACILKFDVADLIPQYDKILYLDGDILVRGDLSDLYNIELGSNYIAGIKDMAAVVTVKLHEKLGVTDYFNGGVMLLNSKLIRDLGLRKVLYSVKKEHPEYRCMDQDVFNDVFKGNIVFSHVKYNLMGYNFKIAGYSMDDINSFYDTHYESLEKMIQDSIIIHLTNERKPWLYFDTFMGEEWRAVFGKSPFYKDRIVYRDILSYDNGDLIKNFMLPYSRKVWKDNECIFYLFRMPVAKRVQYENYKQMFILGIPAVKKAWSGNIQDGTMEVRLKVGRLTVAKRKYELYNIKTYFLGMRILKKANINRMENLLYQIRDLSGISAGNAGYRGERVDAEELKRQLVLLDSYKLINDLRFKETKKEIEMTTPTAYKFDVTDIKTIVKSFEYLSFSQMGQDRMLIFLIRQFTNWSLSALRYLDIGAADPIGHNNTYLFYCAGARGVLVEPNEVYKSDILKLRPDDKYLDFGVTGDDTKELEYCDFGLEGRGHNTFDVKAAEKSAELYDLKSKQLKKLININELIETYFEDGYPDIVSIDTEGYDASIMYSMNLEKYRPMVICIEDKSTKLSKYLKEKGYISVANTLVDNVFFDKEKIEKNEDIIRF